MMRLAPIVLLCLMSSASLAESLRLEGQTFRPTVPIVWEATNAFSKTVTVFKANSQQIPPSILSNILAITSFSTLGVKVSDDKKQMHWEAHNDHGTLIRSLDINTSTGWINYFNSEATEQTTNAAHGVPTPEAIPALAALFLQRVGGDSNQLCFHPASGTEQHRTLYDKKPWKGGHIILDDYTMRGIMLSRQIDGIRFIGAGARGGIAIDFGNNASVAKLQVVWPKLIPFKTYPSATSDQILELIKKGKGVLPSEQSSDPGQIASATKITIKKMTPYYWGVAGGTTQSFVYPFLELEAEAKLSPTNTISFNLECPIYKDER